MCNTMIGGTNPASGTSKYSNTVCLHMLVIYFKVSYLLQSQASLYLVVALMSIPALIKPNKDVHVGTCLIVLYTL